MIGLGAQFSQLIKSQWYSENDLLSHCSVTAFEKNAYKESFEVTQRHGVTSNKSKSFFFLSRFSFTNIHDSQYSRRRTKDISLTPLYDSHLLYRHLDISQAITSDSWSLHIASSQTWIAKHWVLSTSRWPLSYAPKHINASITCSTHQEGWSIHFTIFYSNQAKLQELSKFKTTLITFQPTLTCSK